MEDSPLAMVQCQVEHVEYEYGRENSSLPDC
jgi:hypothetical protein